jgi:hypothetical protein
MDMSRLVTLLTVFAMVGALCGCKSPTKKEQPKQEQPKQEQAKQAQAKQELPKLVEPKPAVAEQAAQPAGQTAAPATKAAEPGEPTGPGSKSNPIPIPYSAEKITIDGDLADWSKIASLPSPFMNKPTSVFKICWREDGLYGSVTAVDSEITPQPGTPWTGDTVEIFLEKGLSYVGGYTNNTGQYAFSPGSDRDDGKCHVTTIWPKNDKALADKLVNAWKKTADGYVVEFMIPADVMAPAKMEAGTKFLLNLALSDAGQPTEQFYCNKDESSNYCRPVSWGTVILAK